MSPGEEKDFELSWPEDSQSMYAGKTAALPCEAAQDPGQSGAGTRRRVRPVGRREIRNAGRPAQRHPRIAARVEKKTPGRQRVPGGRARQAGRTEREMDYPPVVVEDQIDSMVSEFARQLRMYGIDNLETFLQQTGPVHGGISRLAARASGDRGATQPGHLRSYTRKKASRFQTQRSRSASQEMRAGFGGEDATDEQEQMAEMLADSMRSGPGRPVLESQIIQEKSLRRLLAIARGEEVPEPGAPDPDGRESRRAATKTVDGIRCRDDRMPPRTCRAAVPTTPRRWNGSGPTQRPTPKRTTPRSRRERSGRLGSAAVCESCADSLAEPQRRRVGNANATQTDLRSLLTFSTVPRGRTVLGGDVILVETSLQVIARLEGIHDREKPTNA